MPPFATLTAVLHKVSADEVTARVTSLPLWMQIVFVALPALCILALVAFLFITGWHWLNQKTRSFAHFALTLVCLVVIGCSMIAGVLLALLAEQWAALLLPVTTGLTAFYILARVIAPRMPGVTELRLSKDGLLLKDGTAAAGQPGANGSAAAAPRRSVASRAGIPNGAPGEEDAHE